MAAPSQEINPSCRAHGAQVKLSQEDRELIRLALLALQEADQRTLDTITMLGTLRETEAIRHHLFDRIDQSRALHVRFIEADL